MNEDFNDLDFHHGLPDRSLVDRKNGLRINIGKADPLPEKLSKYECFYGIMLGLQQSGMAHDLLDSLCAQLARDCKSHDIDILVTKSDRAFDSQWYIIGDLRRLLRLHKDALVRPPFHESMHSDIEETLRFIERRSEARS